MVLGLSEEFVVDQLCLFKGCIRLFNRVDTDGIGVLLNDLLYLVLLSVCLLEACDLLLVDCQITGFHFLLSLFVSDLSLLADGLPFLIRFEEALAGCEDLPIQLLQSLFVCIRVIWLLSETKRRLREGRVVHDFFYGGRHETGIQERRITWARYCWRWQILLLIKLEIVKPLILD